MVIDSNLLPGSAGFSTLNSELDSPVQMLMAAGLIFAVLPVFVYIVVQRYIISGVAAGAVNGYCPVREASMANHLPELDTSGRGRNLDASDTRKGTRGPGKQLWARHWGAERRKIVAPAHRHVMALTAPVSGRM